MHRVSSEYTNWRGHAMVCGLHGVGLRIVDLLNLSGMPTVVIDDNPDLRLARSLIDWGIPHIAGRAQAAATLAEAGLAGADAVICALEDELGALEAALLTRELRADVRVVVQLSNPTNMLVSRRIEESLGRGRITGLRGHVLVIGLGAVGMRAAGRLAAAGSDVVVVEKDPGNRHLGQVRALGLPVVLADATLPETLHEVSLTSAAAVAVLTSDDLANLETAPGPASWPSAGPPTRATWGIHRAAAPGCGPVTRPTWSARTRSCSRGRAGTGRW
jgi:Trk K+ transport system NAD-binding subunit